MRKLVLYGAIAIGVVLYLGVGGGPLLAYTNYSEDGDETNCAQSGCHGDFRASSYVSATDGMDWGNLHNVHRSDMLAFDCDACHVGSSRLPVPLASSDGGDGLSAIGCMGCHGRNEDNTAENPSFPNGLGAGLRQQHHIAGVTGCANCHDDADPAKYTPVGESVLPDYYANPGNNHPDMPTASCNDDGSEDFAGAASGLDNDGDGDSDGDDMDCIEVPIDPTTWSRVKARYR